jgi:choline dehydrogenase-like flavoprotein
MILEGKDLPGGLSEKADVCIIGSGAGGAYVALELAQRGISVVVLEEGGAHFRRNYTGRIRDAFASLYRNNGLDFSVGWPAVLIPTGKCLGGTTVVNMGVCFRAPDAVLSRWKSEGLLNYGPDEMALAYDRVEARMNIQPTKPEVIGRGGELIIKGAELLGLHPKPISRNVTAGCKGCGCCAYGCTEDAKLSMVVQIIPEASEAGVRFFCDTLAEDIIIENGRAAGVRGRLLDRATGAKLRAVEIHAKIVVLAAGALLTPLLLAANGIARRNPARGNHLKLHLCTRATGIFDEKVKAFRGACQNVYVDDFQSEGIMLEATFTGPCSQIPGLFGWGGEFWEKAKNYGNMAGIGILTSEKAEGRVCSAPNGKPVIFFQPAPRDAEVMHKGMLLADRILFAAGARKVLNGSYAFPEANSTADLEHAAALKVRPQDLLIMAFHPQGTCRMGVDPKNSIVSPSGECHDLAHLYIADASVFPSSIGVNPQETIWAMAHKISENIARDVFRL